MRMRKRFSHFVMFQNLFSAERHFFYYKLVHKRSHLEGKGTLASGGAIIGSKAGNKDVL